MKPKKAFTLIELLVVIAIIGLLATLSVLALNNARMKARDTKRLADVKQMQTALELYFNSTGHYPTAEEFDSGKIEYYSATVGTTTYMVEIPSAPTPVDGDCLSSDNTYTYIPAADFSDYDLNFCVAKASSDLPDGNLVAFSGGIKGRPHSNVQTFTLSYISGSNGLIVGVSTQTVNSGENGSEVIATANPGYHFVDWSDSSTDNPRTDLNVVSDISVTANFAIAPWACGQAIVDSRDSQSYPTVQIGTQCWFSKNLTYLPSVVAATTKSETIPYYYVYGYQGTSVTTAKLQSNYINYGVLYNHPAALTACPVDWHLPSDPEFTILENYLGGISVAATKLAASSTSTPIAWYGTNSSGFTALPGGYYDAYNLIFMNVNSTFGTWTSTITSGWIVQRDFATGNSPVSRSFNNVHSWGRSLRCLQD